MPRGALAWDKVAGESICGNNRGCGVSSDPFRESKGRALELGSGGQRQAGFRLELGSRSAGSTWRAMPRCVRLRTAKVAPQFTASGSIPVG